MGERVVGILDLIKPTSIGARLRDWSRGWPMLLVFVIALAVVSTVAPAKIWLSIAAIAKMGLGGYAGLWLHRWAAPYLRPHSFLDSQTGLPLTEQHARMFGWAVGTRTALIVAGVISAGFIP
jgi:uncharacterized protein YqfA (UPF0365 family)